MLASHTAVSRVTAQLQPGSNTGEQLIVIPPAPLTPSVVQSACAQHTRARTHRHITQQHLHLVSNYLS